MLLVSSISWSWYEGEGLYRQAMVNSEQGMLTSGDVRTRRGTLGCAAGRQSLSFVDDVCILVVRERHTVNEHCSR